VKTRRNIEEKTLEQSRILGKFNDKTSKSVSAYKHTIMYTYIQEQAFF